MHPLFVCRLHLQGSDMTLCSEHVIKKCAFGFWAIDELMPAFFWWKFTRQKLVVVLVDQIRNALNFR